MVLGTHFSLVFCEGLLFHVRCWPCHGVALRWRSLAVHRLAASNASERADPEEFRDSRAYTWKLRVNSASSHICGNPRLVSQIEATICADIVREGGPGRWPPHGEGMPCGRTSQKRSSLSHARCRSPSFLPASGGELPCQKKRPSIDVTRMGATGSSVATRLTPGTRGPRLGPLALRPTLSSGLPCSPSVE